MFLQTLPSTVQSAVLILAREICSAAGLQAVPESVTTICQVIGASKSQSYEMLPRVKKALGGLQYDSGRPARDASLAVEMGLFAQIRDFLMEHPGCVESRGSRRVYHDSYRDFVVRLLSPGGLAADLTHQQAADAFGVPLGTLKDWLSIKLSTTSPEAEPNKAPAHETAPEEEETPTSRVQTADPIIAVILREFPRWKGSFKAFCRFLKTQQHLPCGRTFIASVLEAAGLRRPNRRGRNRRPWSEDTFRELFPGAQWIGDGKTVIIDWLGQPMAFNFEALIDAGADAIVGVEVTDTEDEEAVLAALVHARTTTAGDPLAVTLDQRPSNHTETVREAVAPAQLLASIKARPTAKAPIEGCFGLFSQTAPPLVVTGSSPREQARSALKLYILGWAWARNRRPRRRLGGRTPAEAYQDARPTDAEVTAAKNFIAELKQREEKSRQTLEAKADPVRRQLLHDAFAEFRITDPDNRLIPSLAGSFATEAILRGLAIFRAKTNMGTLPPGADPGRYLAGIIRNIHGEIEDAAFADALLDLRLRHRELSLQHLEREADRIAHESSSNSMRCWALLQRALETEALVDFRFWSQRLREALEALPPRVARALYLWMSQRIARSHTTQRDRRRELVATLSAAATVAAG